MNKKSLKVEQATLSETDLKVVVGKWELTKPVEIMLNKGPNILRFTRPAPSRGVTIKQFTLTPFR